MTGQFRKLQKGIENLLEQAAHVVIVTNEIFSDAVVFDGDMDSYLEYLGKINQAAAQRADEVVEVIYGIPVFHKSADPAAIFANNLFDRIDIL